MEAFDRCSTPDSVVLVEASDLRRALAFRPRATPELAESARAEALASTDALAGAILERLDPERDAVVVVAPDDAARPMASGCSASTRRSSSRGSSPRATRDAPATCSSRT